MHQGSRDLVSGAVLFVLSVALYLAIPGQVETLTGDSLTPASLPFTVTAVIGGLAAILFFQGLRTRAAAPSSNQSETNAAGLLYVGATIVVIALYIGLIPWIGYIAATASVILILALLFRNRNWKQILILMIVAPPFILIFFRYTMLVLLPQGKLF